MALDRFRHDFERTVYGKVKSMTIQEFSDFLFAFYNRAWNDGYNCTNDETWIRCEYPYGTSLFPWEESEQK